MSRLLVGLETGRPGLKPQPGRLCAFGYKSGQVTAAAHSPKTQGFTRKMFLGFHTETLLTGGAGSPNRCRLAEDEQRHPSMQDPSGHFKLCPSLS